MSSEVYQNFNNEMWSRAKYFFVSGLHFQRANYFLF